MVAPIALTTIYAHHAPTTTASGWCTLSPKNHQQPAPPTSKRNGISATGRVAPMNADVTPAPHKCQHYRGRLALLENRGARHCHAHFHPAKLSRRVSS